MDGPWIEGTSWRILALALGYSVTLALSGRIVGYFVGTAESGTPVAPVAPAVRSESPRFDAHSVIGKCENLIALTFVIAGELTGLALIFAGKSIVRAKEENQSYYLGGTLVNLVWSLAMGMLMRLAVVGPLSG